MKLETVMKNLERRRLSGDVDDHEPSKRTLAAMRMIIEADRMLDRRERADERTRKAVA